MDGYPLWSLLTAVGASIVGTAAVFSKIHETIIKQKDATIEYLREINSPNLSQWDFGAEECQHKEEKRIKFKVKFSVPPAIIVNQGSDVGDPVGIIITNVTIEDFTLKTVGPPMRPYALGHSKNVLINWIALSKNKNI